MSNNIIELFDNLSDNEKLAAINLLINKVKLKRDISNIKYGSNIEDFIRLYLKVDREELYTVGIDSSYTTEKVIKFLEETIYSWDRINKITQLNESL